MPETGGSRRNVDRQKADTPSAFLLPLVLGKCLKPRQVVVIKAPISLLATLTNSFRLRRGHSGQPGSQTYRAHKNIGAKYYNIHVFCPLWERTLKKLK